MYGLYSHDKGGGLQLSSVKYCVIKKKLGEVRIDYSNCICLYGLICVGLDFYCFPGSAVIVNVSCFISFV